MRCIEEVNMKSKKNLTSLKSLNSNKDAHRVPCTVNREPSINDNEQVMGSVLGSQILDDTNHQSVGGVEGSGMVGNNVSGSGITSGDNNCVQHNHVTDNVTGITGTGHTIIVNQCPQELIDFLIEALSATLNPKTLQTL